MNENADYERAMTAALAEMVIMRGRLLVGVMAKTAKVKRGGFGNIGHVRKLYAAGRKLLRGNKQEKEKQC